MVNNFRDEGFDFVEFPPIQMDIQKEKNTSLQTIKSNEECFSKEAPKSSKLTEQEEVSLSPSAKPVRKDLVNKTVIRTLKSNFSIKNSGHYTQLFEDEFPEDKKGGKKETLRQFEQNTHDFVTAHFGHLADELSQHSVTVEELAAFLRILVNPELSKFIDKSKSQRNLAMLYTESIYKYSHKRFKKLIKENPFSYLFSKFLKSGECKDFIEKDENLAKNPVPYLQAVQNMEKMFY